MNMQTAPNLDNVCSAIYTLYHDPDTGGKERASTYLDELQRSIYAWKIADDILQHKNDLELCYFAAHTMKVKIQYSFHELPEESHSSLRDSLLNHISKITAETGEVTVRQLCLALTHLALQMSTWKNPIQDLITKLGSDIHQIHALLEILTFLPEELGSRSLRLGENRRNEIIRFLKQEMSNVLQLLNTCIHTFGQTDLGILRKVFRCCASWFATTGVCTNDALSTPLVVYAFQVLSNQHTTSMIHEAASDAICNAFLVVEDTQNHQILAEVLFQGVYSLVEAYHLSVAQEDADKVLNYCRIFTELAESFLDQIVEFPNVGFGNLQNLDLLLICVGYHEYEVVDVTFNYWYRLSEALYKKDNEALNLVFEPYIQRLITALCKQCQLEQDHDGIPEKNDDFAEFRKHASDVIKDCVFIIGSNKCFQQLFENLKNQGTNATWDVTEATLFVMGAIAKNICADENTVVPQVLEALLNLPDECHVAVRFTSINLLGELCCWIEKHPQYLQHVLNFLLKSLQQPSLGSVAATALKHICSTCKKQMAPHFPVLLQILQVIDKLSISNEATEGLLKGTALILGEMPNENITNGLRELCQAQLKPLGEVLKESERPREGAKNDPVIWLDRLAVIFRNVSTKVVNGQIHPCQPVVMDVWPLLSETCNKYKGDTRIIERCCRCIRFIVRCVNKHFSVLLQPLVQQMVELYQQHQHSCFLYLGSVLVDEYGSEPECIQGLIDMLQSFCGPTFHILEQPNGLRDHPDTVDDLFRLCARFLQWAPVPFLRSAAIKPAMECAILACCLDHKDANISVIKFFQDLIGRRTEENAANNPQRYVLVEKILAEYGQSMVTAMIQASVVTLPQYMVTNISAVLYDLLQFNKEWLKKWLEAALMTLPTKGIGGSITATQEQLMEFHNNVLSATHMKTISSSLREFARLYR